MVSDPTKTLENLLTDTDLCEGKEFFRSEWDKDLAPREKHLLEWGKTKIGADALFVQYPPVNASCFPLIYFRRLEEADPSKIAEAHKLAWNMGQAPLLFVVLPGKIRVYTTYERPNRDREGTLDDNAGLIDIIDLLKYGERERQKLTKYRRAELLSGRFWEENKARFKPDFRVQRTILDNLAAIRDLLLDNNKKLNPKFVNRLLGRSIFIEYLQDRKDSGGRNAFPQGFFDNFRSGALSFTDVLADKKGTYRLFRFLEEKFNGDIFPVESREEGAVEKQDLNLLSEFLRGDILLPRRQLAFWPYYSFDAIPIEFISNLYEEFFHFEKEKMTARDGRKKRFKAGTFYTPHRLVDYLMDEVLPWEGQETNIRILDPACGSAIFLVEAYRRLISRWQQKNPQERLSTSVLKDLLTKNLHGVDSNPEAILVAAFSLYLTMCDYLEPRHIWNFVKFPFLRNNNLWVKDFFDFVDRPPEGADKFDLVIGNPPWESNLSEPAVRYLKKHSCTVGDKQIAQAFLWAAPEICKDDGEVVLIAPSKGLLFNISPPNMAFRKEFFSSFKVKTIINFSAARRSLFPKAVGPAAPIFYQPTPPSASGRIIYCNPKPCYSPEDNWHYVIEPQDIAYIPLKHAVEDQHIWKAAMWGTPRDWELVRKLSDLPSLKDVCESRGWIAGEGIIIGNRRNKAEWLTNKPYVSPEALQPFWIDEDSLPELKEERFERPRLKSKKIFEGPHLLISQSPKGSSGFKSALLKGYAVFSQSIVGISCSPSDESVLSALNLAINSLIPVYYAMHTSGRWLVERDELAKDEIMSLPLPSKILEGEEKIDFDKLKMLALLEQTTHSHNDEIFSMYELTNDEISLIRDAIEFTLDYFRRKGSSEAKEYPPKDMLLAYGRTFCRILNGSFRPAKGGFSATILTGDMPMVLVHAMYDHNNGREKITIRDAPDALAEKIDYVNKILLEKGSTGVYVRRNLRVYDGNNIYLVKRRQRRFWTKSAAFRDADESYADIMRSWRG